MLWLVFCIATIAPVASAILDNTYVPPSTGPLDKDNPELISVLKTHTAYVGVTQQARMNGVISYIDRISEGAGSTNLRWIQDDYLAAASSIPLLSTSDDITAAREEMRAQSIRFLEETNTQMAAFNGNVADLRECTNATEGDAENNFSLMPGSAWLIKGTARLTAFNASADTRAALLIALTRKGVDITGAAKLSNQIDAKRTELQEIVIQNKNGAVLSLNSGIALLNDKFRTTVDDALKNREIQLKSAAMMAMK